MTRDETLRYIHSLGKFRLPASLDRMKTVCEKLGNPQNSFKSIHIAGTNGKGSTAAMLTNILIKGGYRVGSFISPFVVSFNERIQINGNYISDSDLVRYAETVKSTGVELNEFEFITAMGFCFFGDKKIDVAVIETGLGGRLDATNILQNVAVSVITKLGLDHTAVLGETIEEIAAEKCGIIKSCTPVVTVPNQEGKALAVIKQHTNSLVIPAMPVVKSVGINGSEFVSDGKEYRLSLLGVHQIYNAAAAIEAVKLFSPDILHKTMFDGLCSTEFPARLEIVSKSPPVIIDGAHNPDGALALSEFLKQTGQKVTVVMAMMRDKNCREFVRIIAENADCIVAAEIDNPRCMPAKELREIACEYIGNTDFSGDIAAALKKAASRKNPVLITGSLYFASAARKFYKK